LENMKIRIATLSILMIFLASAPLFVSPQVSAQETPALAKAKPFYQGQPTNLPANKVLMGPFTVTPSSVTPSLVKPNLFGPKNMMPYHNPRQGIKSSATVLTNPNLPVIKCKPVSAGCDTIDTSTGGATGVKSLNAIDDGGNYPTIGDVEPPDGPLCAGNGYVMNVLNQGEMAVYNTKTLARASGDITLDNLMGLTSVPASLGGPWSSGGDPSCLYDYDNGGHWFITEIVSNSSEANLGPFGGCFVAKKEGCFEGIAVSVTNNPTGAYNVYFFNANFNSTEPGYPYLLNDFAKIGNTRDAFLMFYDEFPLLGGGLGGGFFNGAQEFAFNKKALELGFPATSPYFNIAYVNMGYIPTPDGTCVGTGGVTCWYQVIPGQSPDPTQYDNSHGGSGFMLGTLDFVGAGDNRISAFYWTGLNNLVSINCSTCSSIVFGGQLFTGTETYYNPGYFAPQKAGPIPLGDSLSLPEGPINTNGDGFTQVSTANDQVWGAISTEVNQQYGTGGCSEATPSCELHAGVAYWVIGTNSFDSSLVFSLTNQAYVTARHEDLEFASMASGGTKQQDGGTGDALMAFSLSGNGGPTGADSGGFYPSTAWGSLTTSSNGLLGKVIHIADLGMSPQDGFEEYPSVFGGRPRWGDYTWAIFLPNSGGKVFFATEYIQSPNCSDSQYTIDPSCGGTRDKFANWGSSINFVVP